MRLKAALMPVSLALLYRYWPAYYLVMARNHYQRVNPQILDVISSVEQIDLWPCALWVFARKYVEAGGLYAYPESAGYEDALFKDASTRDTTPGPIQDSMKSLLDMGDAAIENITAGDRGKIFLNEIIRPVLRRDKRLASQLDEDDLTNEALLYFLEARSAPWEDWHVGNKWKPNRIGPDDEFLKDVVQSRAARSFGSNRNGERDKAYYEDTYEAIDETVDDPFEAVETRMLVDDLVNGLPPEQRKAAKTRHLAYEHGLTLAEASEISGLDPSKVRENIKAVQRKKKLE